MESKHTIRAIIVTLAGTKYIGDVVFDLTVDGLEHAHSMSSKELVIDAVTKDFPLPLRNAIIIDELKIPMPNPQNPGQVSINRMINVMPFVHVLDIENSLIYVKAAEIIFLADMSATDKAEHEVLLTEGRRMMAEQRMRRAGIVTPTSQPVDGRGRH